MSSVKGVGRGPGLDVDGQYQVFTVPLVPMRCQGLMLYPDRVLRFCLQQGAVSGMGEVERPGTGSFTSYTPMSG